MAEPARFIQTTLVYEDKAASFIFIEGLDSSALDELANEKLIRFLPPIAPFFARSPRGVRSARLTPNETKGIGLAAELIDNPFYDLRAGGPVHISDLPGSDKWWQWTEALLQSESVIVTRSPPEQVSFQSLSKSANSIVVAAWIGSEAASALGTPTLLYVTVSMGIVILGAAVGVSKALENGLNQWLTRKMNGPPKKPRRRGPPLHRRSPPPTSKRRTASPKGKAKH
jgi:hypothetical protein